MDARKQTRQQLQARRLEVVEMHQNGVPVMQIVERTGLSWPTVNGALKLWKEGGEGALMPAARGRKARTGRALTPGQEQEIRDCLCKRPEDQALWDRAAVQTLIAQNF
jgi:transposase